MQKSAGDEVVFSLKEKGLTEGRTVDAGLLIIKDAGHQLFLESPQNSLDAVLKICGLNVPKPA